jgi:DNA-binding winged helix-turn-helix (wHTH) protein
MTYRFGPFRYETESRRLFRGAEEVPLKHKARELLVLLLQNPDRLMTHEDLIERVWPTIAITDDAVRFQISELRKALGPEAESYLKTIPREGYRWEEPVRSDGAPGKPRGASGISCRLVLETREVALATGENIIGRDQDAVLWIDHTGVSRHHARILVSDGGATLEDLGSKNGTYLSGARLDGASPLSDGDEIRIGPTRMTFRALFSGASTQTEDAAAKPAPK